MSGPEGVEADPNIGVAFKFDPKAAGGLGVDVDPNMGVVRLDIVEPKVVGTFGGDNADPNIGGRFDPKAVNVLGGEVFDPKIGCNDVCPNAVGTVFEDCPNNGAPRILEPNNPAGLTFEFSPII